MNLTQVRVPSAPKALLAVSSKTYPHVLRQAEDAATILRAEAEGGSVHPYTVMKAWKNFTADAAAIKASHEAALRDLDDALAILGGAAVLPEGRFAKVASEAALLASGFSAAASEPAREKSSGIIADAIVRLSAVRRAAQEDLDGNEHRNESVKRRLAVALVHAVAKHRGAALRFSLNDARELLGWGDILPQDDRPLPAAASSPYFKASDPRRLASVLTELCASPEAPKLAKAQAAMAKRAHKARPKSQSDAVRDELKNLPRA